MAVLSDILFGRLQSIENLAACLLAGARQRDHI